jgi:hypothetical protein
MNSLILKRNLVSVLFHQIIFELLLSMKLKTYCVLIALATFTGAETLDSLPPCKEEQWKEVKDAMRSFPVGQKCVDDIGVSFDDFLDGENAGFTTIRQAKIFAHSSDCKGFFDATLRESVRQNCFELNELTKVTWEMFNAAIEVLVYPRTSNPCQWDDLKAHFAPLAQNPNVVPCLAQSSFLQHFATKTLPTQVEWEQFANVTYCRALYSDVQSILSDLPHCAVDTKGIDIHAVEDVSFVVFVEWMELLSRFLERHVSQKLKLMSYASSSVDHVQTMSDIFLMGTYMLFGAILAVIVMNAKARNFSRRSTPHEENTVLLSY